MKEPAHYDEQLMIIMKLYFVTTIYRNVVLNFDFSNEMVIHLLSFKKIIKPN